MYILFTLLHVCLGIEKVERCVCVCVCVCMCANVWHVCVCTRVHVCVCVCEMVVGCVGCSDGVGVQRRESEMGVGEVSVTGRELLLEDQMLEQSGYTSHGK